MEKNVNRLKRNCFKIIHYHNIMQKILIVGYGSIGKRHLKNLIKNYNVEIIICTKQKIENIKKKNIKIYSNLDDCLKEQPDIGFITNETKFHIPTAIKLAKHGLDLFIEKPVSDSIIGHKTLTKLIEEKKIITQVGCMWRFHPCIKKIKEMIEAKKIGRVLSIQIENGSFLPDYHPYEDYRKSYAAKKNLGGGVLLTQVHELDYLYWFFGLPKEVFSITEKISDLEISVDDISASVLKFKNKIIAELHLDYFQKPDFKKCKIKGTKGTIYWDSDLNEVKLFDIKKEHWITILKLKKFEKNTMFLSELEHFFDCVKNKKDTINNFEEGVKVLKIGLALKRASKSKKMINIKND